MYLKIAFLVVLFLSFLPVTAMSQEIAGEDITPEDVKKFLDPTVMNNFFEYRFESNFLPGSAKLFTHSAYLGFSLNYWSGAWAEVHFLDFSSSGTDAPSGVGDTLLGWGVVARDNLSSRFTGAAFWLEAMAPTGSADKGTGVGSWILAPGGGIALNPTDAFPVYISGRYLHSVGSLGFYEERPAGETKVRSIELNIETVHLLPKGFFVGALPSFTLNLEQDFNFFALGLGGGKALSKNVLISAAYVHHLAGEKTFNQAFVIGLGFQWGEEKVKPSTGLRGY